MSTFQIIYVILLAPISIVCLCTIALGVLVLVTGLRGK